MRTLLIATAAASLIIAGCVSLKPAPTEDRVEPGPSPVAHVEILGVVISALPACLPAAKAPGVRGARLMSEAVQLGEFENASDEPVYLLAGELWTGEGDLMLAESALIPPHETVAIPTRRVGVGTGGESRRPDAELRFADPFVRMTNTSADDPFSTQLTARWAAYYLGDWTGEARSAYVTAWNDQLEQSTDYCMRKLGLLSDTGIHGLRIESFDYQWECEDMFADRAMFVSYARDLLRSYLVAAAVLGRPEPTSRWGWGDPAEDRPGGKLVLEDGSVLEFGFQLVPPSYFYSPFDYVRDSQKPGLLPVTKAHKGLTNNYEIRLRKDGPVLHRFSFNDCEPDGTANFFR
ncbi:MAG: hypothetical protein H6839_10360 [Planctomycetes bacterium]|nr:hypothetical protein [Planctomycetota bacterium]